MRRKYAILSVFVGIAIIILVITNKGKDDSSKATSTTIAGASTTAVKTATQPCPETDGSSKKVTKFDGVPPTCIDPTKSYTAVMDTDAGPITIKLAPDKAPQTVNNFVYLSRYHFYDGLTFHRVIKDFVLQGGDPEGTGRGGPGYTFNDELPEPSDYQAGSLAMANAGPNTNGSQFFIVVSKNGANSLVNGAQGAAAYSLFGQVTEGMNTVKKIEADGGNTSDGKPAKVHKIKTVTIKED